MALSKFDICSQALTRIGANTITSFTGGSTESTVAGQQYETIVETALSSYRWRFATKQDTPNKLGTAPEDEWDTFYQIPSDLLVLQAVKVSGKTIEFDRYQDKIACNCDSGIVIDYTFRPSEIYWPAHFIELVIQRLEVVFLMAVRRDRSAAADRAKFVEEVTFPRMKAIDAQQQSARRLPKSRLVSVRGN